MAEEEEEEPERSEPSPHTSTTEGAVPPGPAGSNTATPSGGAQLGGSAEVSVVYGVDSARAADSAPDGPQPAGAAKGQESPEKTATGEAPEPRTAATRSDLQYVHDAFPTASIGDVVAAEDAIGFEPYVQAVAEFLTDLKTEPPLTISIEGEWGMGKSSFMKQLEVALRAKDVKSVWFNAWRNDKDESLWSSFALELPRQLAISMGRSPYRLIAWLRLYALRFKWAEGWLEMLTFVTMLLFYLSIIIFILTLFSYGHVAIMPDVETLRDAALQKEPIA